MTTVLWMFAFAFVGSFAAIGGVWALVLRHYVSGLALMLVGGFLVYVLLALPIGSDPRARAVVFNARGTPEIVYADVPER